MVTYGIYILGSIKTLPLSFNFSVGVASFLYTLFLFVICMFCCYVCICIGIIMPFSCLFINTLNKFLLSFVLIIIILHVICCYKRGLGKVRSLLTCYYVVNYRSLQMDFKINCFHATHFKRCPQLLFLVNNR